MKKTNKEELKGKLLLDVRLNKNNKVEIHSEGDGNADVLLTLLVDACATVFCKITNTFNYKDKILIKNTLLHHIDKQINEKISKGN